MRAFISEHLIFFKLGFKRGSISCFCFKRCYRIALLIFYLASKQKRPPRANFYHAKISLSLWASSYTTFLEVSFTSASQKKLYLPQLQPYSSTMTSLGHLVKLDAPSLPIKFSSGKKVIVLHIQQVKSSIMGSHRAIDCHTEFCKLLILC